MNSVVAHVNHNRFTGETPSVTNLTIDKLALRISEKRAGQGIRAVAKEVGVSAATLSRVENGKLPDLATFGKICEWLGDDPSTYLGLQSSRPAQVHVHFKKGATLEVDSARALQELIIATKAALDAGDL